MKRAAIVSAVRTPVGKCAGAMAELDVELIGAAAIREALKRAKLDPAQVGEVYYGNCRNIDLKTPARVAAIAAGIPIEVPAVTVERGCASALGAIWTAAMSIMTGQETVCVAGGMESTSRAPSLIEAAKRGKRSIVQMVTARSLPRGMKDLPMGMTAERVAEKLGITRTACDEWAELSHARAAAAQKAGLFDGQLAPVEVPAGKGKTELFTRDETVREGTTVETLAKLKPSFTAEGVCTAGNSSPLTDGASALVLMDPDRARAEGLEILAYVAAYAAVGCDPDTMGLGPVYATQKLLREQKLELSDIGLIELNEAFASQTIGCVRGLGLDAEKVNVNGGAIALGHPFGATGGILSAKLVYEMKRRGTALGLITFCVGGGQGVSLLLERA